MLFTITSPHNLVKSSLKKIAVEVLELGGNLLIIFALSFRDGQLKRTKVKPELRQQKQEDFAQMLKVD
jgi:hypothetical protein